jgi:hypothetical protein
MYLLPGNLGKKFYYKAAAIQATREVQMNKIRTRYKNGIEVPPSNHRNPT